MLNHYRNAKGCKSAYVKKKRLNKYQFHPPIALRTDLSQITTELWEIPVLRMAINFTYDYIALLFGVSVFSPSYSGRHVKGL